MIKWGHLTIGARRKWVKARLADFPELENDMHRLTFISYRNKVIRFAIGVALSPIWFPFLIIGSMGFVFQAIAFVSEKIGDFFFAVGNTPTIYRAFTNLAMDVCTFSNVMLLKTRGN